MILFITPQKIPVELVSLYPVILTIILLISDGDGDGRSSVG
jgi:hypothetical protein